MDEKMVRLVKSGLSVKEAEIALLVFSGLDNVSIAKKIFRSEKLVKFHLGNIYLKYGFNPAVMMNKRRKHLINMIEHLFGGLHGGANKEV